MTEQMPEKVATGEGATLSEAVKAAASSLGLEPSDVHYKLDMSHFRNAEGRNIGVDTVRVFAWARNQEELAAARDARTWMIELLGLMGFEGQVSGTVIDKDVIVKVKSAQAPHLVGRAGATIDAIRTLLLAHLGHRYQEWRFVLDIEDGRSQQRTREHEHERERDHDRDRRGRDRDRDRGGESREPRGRHESRDPRREGRDRHADAGRPRHSDRPRGDESDASNDKQLAKMARKIAQRVLETGESELIRKELNSYARRVVHMAIAEFAGLETESIGDGPYKQIRVNRKNGEILESVEDQDTEERLEQD